MLKSKSKDSKTNGKAEDTRKLTSRNSTIGIVEQRNSKDKRRVIEHSR